MNVTSFRTLRRRPTGFTLIEVLVALAVLSIGLLGLAALQATGFKYNSDAYSRTQASILAYDIIDRMRANPKGASDGDYVVNETDVAAKLSSFASATKCDVSTCGTPSAVALYDLGRWYEAQRAVLPTPGTPSTIDKVGNVHTIVIRWRERGDREMSQTWVVEF